MTFLNVGEVSEVVCRGLGLQTSENEHDRVSRTHQQQPSAFCASLFSTMNWISSVKEALVVEEAMEQANGT